MFFSSIYSFSKPSLSIHTCKGDWCMNQQFYFNTLTGLLIRSICLIKKLQNTVLENVWDANYKTVYKNMWKWFQT